MSNRPIRLTLGQKFSHYEPVLWVAAICILIAAIWASVKVLSPAPPRAISMGTGGVDGAYHQFGLRYQALLKENGITLTLLPSSGSVENLKRLHAAEVSAAFVQGGLATRAAPGTEAPDTDLKSLATIGFEPVWIFSHTLKLNDGLGALAGKKVGVGVAGSGNHKVALELLAAYGLLDARGAPLSAIQLVTEGGIAAAAQLQAHALDALVVVAAPQAAAVVRLLQDPGIQLASLVHAEGLARSLPYFQTVSLKRGSVDVARNRPAADITLLATTANLVIRDDLHPALAYLLLEAAHQTHGAASLLTRPGEFPSAQGTDFPLAEESARYFKNGRPFLQTYLPFWLANWVQRMVLIVLPLLAVLVPLFKAVPVLRTWRQNTRIYRHYGELKFLERDITTRTLSQAEIVAATAQLNRIEKDVRETRFPLAIADRVYTLRQHVGFVRDTLERQTPGTEANAN